MKFEEGIKKVEYWTKEVCLTLFDILRFIFLLFYQIVILIGAISAIVIALKLYPEIAIIYIKPMLSVFGFLWDVIKIITIIFMVVGGIYISLIIYNGIDYIIKKRDVRIEKRRNKFINDLAKRIGRKKIK